MKISNAGRVGILAVLAIIIATGGIMYMKGRLHFGNYTHHIALYDNVNGLTSSAPVHLKGMKIGEVDEVGLLPGSLDKLYVKFHIKKDIRLPVDTKVEITSSDLLGSKAISINPGKSAEIAASGDTLQGIVEEGLTLTGLADSLVNSLFTVGQSDSGEVRQVP